VQKLLYAVLITSRKLRHYFQQYSISVVTDYPFGDILWNQDATGRISKWAVELGALTIDFKPRTAIKSQALVGFMAEWRENQLPTPTARPEHWVMYFDGSLNLEGAGTGVLLISPTGEQLKYVLQIFWKVSNNEAEYEALLHGLRLAASLGIKRLLVYGDSVGYTSSSLACPPVPNPGDAHSCTYHPPAPGLGSGHPCTRRWTVRRGRELARPTARVCGASRPCVWQRGLVPAGARASRRSGGIGGAARSSLLPQVLLIPPSPAILLPSFSEGKGSCNGLEKGRRDRGAGSYAIARRPRSPKVARGRGGMAREIATLEITETVGSCFYHFF
jgi:hypothetical protein